MTIEIKVPVLPESVSDATVSDWQKKVGDAVKRGEILLELETDKVMLEVPAPEDGVLQEIMAETGAVVTSDQVLAKMQAGAVQADSDAVTKSAATEAASPAAAPAAPSSKSQVADLSPAVRRLVQEHGVDPAQLSGSGRGGRIVKQDVLDYVQAQGNDAAPSAVSTPAADTVAAVAAEGLGPRTEKRVPMTRLRARIAERLLESQSKAAMLTTFNEVNMQAVMDLRKKYKEQFEKSHGVRLGLSSFFVKAVVSVLQQYPVVNAAIDGNDIVYHNFCDIGVAVGGGPRGLVVPVLRNAEHMSLAEIETGIRAYAEKARSGKITLEDMQGGTFTITNGGVYGSMLSTPIINPPQSAILGMHSITERAVAEDGKVVVRPMMYLALSYDHCLIDGEQAVRFLVGVKQALEDPARILLAL